MKNLLFCLVAATMMVGCSDTLSDEESSSKTVILPGMPGLEWMTENLQGFGGTEIDGNTYYTWEEAMAAVEQLGDGWRLPTSEEQKALCDLGSTWDDERKGRWFGSNHATDHDGSLFFPAAGGRHRETGALTYIGTKGYAWFLSPYVSDGTIGYLPGILEFYSNGAVSRSYDRRTFCFPVRCVRNADHDPSPVQPNLEWATENLSGYGGTEVNGRWYYTWDEALAAVLQLGSGWRLPTCGEFAELSDPGSTWDEERKGRWFGGNHDTDHKGSLFFPAAGDNGDDINGGVSGVGTHGDYWSSTYDGGNMAFRLWFSAYSDYVSTPNSYRTSGLSVRCVRNVE